MSITAQTSSAFAWALGMLGRWILPCTCCGLCEHRSGSHNWRSPSNALVICGRLAWTKVALVYGPSPRDVLGTNGAVLLSVWVPAKRSRTERRARSRRTSLIPSRPLIRRQSPRRPSLYSASPPPRRSPDGRQRTSTHTLRLALLLSSSFRALLPFYLLPREAASRYFFCSLPHFDTALRKFIGPNLSSCRNRLATLAHLFANS